MRVIYPGGFDLLHHGHVNALEAAKRIAGTDGTLIVGVNSDTLMKQYKREPHDRQEQRIRNVERLGIADEVQLWQGPEGQADQILGTSADIYIAGTDWLTKDLAHQLRIPDLGWFDRHRISLMYLRRTTGISTTAIVNGEA